MSFRTVVSSIVIDDIGNRSSFSIYFFSVTPDTGTQIFDRFISSESSKVDLINESLLRFVLAQRLIDIHNLFYHFGSVKHDFKITFCFEAVHDHTDSCKLSICVAVILRRTFPIRNLIPSNCPSGISEHSSKCRFYRFWISGCIPRIRVFIDQVDSDVFTVDVQLIFTIYSHNCI